MSPPGFYPPATRQPAPSGGRLQSGRVLLSEARRQPVTGRLPTPWPLTSTMAPLGALPTAPACARAHVRTTMTEWHLTALTEPTELVASELVTNAVQASTDEHGRPCYYNGRMAVIQVRLLADRIRLLLEVWDMSPLLPAVRHVAADAEHGRGLQLVSACTYRWSWKTAPGWPGKCVWAELRRLRHRVPPPRHGQHGWTHPP